MAQSNESEKVLKGLHLHVLDVGQGLATILDLNFKGNDTTERELYFYDTGYHPHWLGSVAKLDTPAIREDSDSDDEEDREENKDEEKFTIKYPERIKATLDELQCPKEKPKTKREKEKYKVNGILISHPHWDHFQGLLHLLRANLLAPHTPVIVTRDFMRLPQLVPKKESTKKQDPKDPKESEKTKRARETPHYRLLLHVNCPDSQEPDLPKSFEILCHKKYEQCVLTTRSGDPAKELPQNATVVSQKDITSRNEYCIILQVNPPESDCHPILLTGDATGNRFEELLNSQLPLSVFQVPHHGSKRSLPRQCMEMEKKVCDLVDTLVSIRAAFNVPFKNEHDYINYADARGKLQRVIDSELPKVIQTPLEDIDDLLSRAMNLVKNVEEKTDIRVADVSKSEHMKVKVEFLKNVLLWAHFYHKIKADLYLISAGGGYGHPSMEVICGISLGCKWRKDKCNIALTNNVRLCERFAIPEELEEAPATLWYLNQCNDNNQLPFFTIDPWCEKIVPNPKPHYGNQGYTRLIRICNHEVNVEGLHELHLHNWSCPETVKRAVSRGSPQREHFCSSQSMTSNPEETLLPVQGNPRHHPLEASAKDSEYEESTDSLDYALEMGSVVPQIVAQQSRQPDLLCGLPQDNKNVHSLGELDLQKTAPVERIKIAPSHIQQPEEYSPDCASALAGVLESAIDPEKSPYNHQDSHSTTVRERVKYLTTGEAATIRPTRCHKTSAIQDEHIHSKPKSDPPIPQIINQGSTDMPDYPSELGSVTEDVTNLPIIGQPSAKSDQRFNQQQVERWAMDRISTSQSIEQPGVEGPEGAIMPATTEANYLDSNGITAREGAEHLTIGEILGFVVGEEKAYEIVQGFPLFVSSVIITWKVNHELTTFRFRTDQVVEEAHLTTTDPVEPLPFHNDQMMLKVKDVSLHILPKYNTHDSAIQLEGECMINDRYAAEFSSVCSSEMPVELQVTFRSRVTPKFIFELLGFDCTVSSLTFRVPGTELDDATEYEAGFAVTQPIYHTTTAKITSVFFAIEPEKIEFHKWLPLTLENNLDIVQVYSTIHNLYMEPRTGFVVNFITIPEHVAIPLEGSLSVSPLPSESDYLCKLELKPHFKRENTVLDITGYSIFGIASTFGPELIQSFKAEVAGIPIGSQIMEAICLRRFVFHITSKKELKAITLEASLSSLSMFSGKIKVSDCILKAGFTVEEGLILECEGELTFFERFSTVIEFGLPTRTSEGRLFFRNYDSDLTLGRFLEGFGMLSEEVLLSPILSQFTDIALKGLDISVSCSDDNLHLSNLAVSMYKKTLDLGVVSLQEIELTFKVKRGTIYFSLGAYIANFLYINLEYDPDAHVLSGQVSVTFSNTISATDSLKTFEVKEGSDSGSSFLPQLGAVIEKSVTGLFSSSENQQQSSPCLTASMNVSIALHKFTLEYLSIEVKDALRIANFNLSTFSFEYSKSPPDSRTTSEVRLLGMLTSVDTGESCAIEVDMESKKEGSRALTVQLSSGPHGSLLKLSSIINQLANCDLPDLPDVGLPFSFDIGLESGSISFELSPFTVSGFDATVSVSKWMVFNDPELCIHKLAFQVKWSRKDAKIEVSFTGKLTVGQMHLSLEGQVRLEGVLVQCKQVPSDKFHFKDALSAYTQRGSEPVQIPEDAHIPPLVVNLRNLKLHVRKLSRLFELDGELVANDPWRIEFGNQCIEVHRVGSILKLEKERDQPACYSALIYGSMKLLDTEVNVQLQLSSDHDHIVAGNLSQEFEYNKIAAYLTGSQEVLSTQESSLTELVPEGLKSITAAKATAALNITRKQFLLYGEVKQFGHGSLLVGRFASETAMMLSLSLDKGFRFSKLTGDLAFIDELLTVHRGHLLVSTIKSCKLSEVLEPYEQVINQITDEHRPHKLFSELKQQTQGEVTKGMTLYAEIDIHACRNSAGLMSKLLSLGGQSEIPNFVLKASIVQGSVSEVSSEAASQLALGSGTDAKESTVASKDTWQMKFQAWINEFKLLDKITFTEIELLFIPGHSLSLSGDIMIDLGQYGKPRFHGCLDIGKEKAKFDISPTSPCEDIIKFQLAKIDVQLRHLQLQLELYYEERQFITTIKGKIEFANMIDVESTVILENLSPRVFHIALGKQLTLSRLLQKCGIIDSWPFPALEIKVSSGSLYYARRETTHLDTIYKPGIHMNIRICLLGVDFGVAVDVSVDCSTFKLSGWSENPVDLSLVKLTGKNFKGGPEITYISDRSGKKLSITGGVQLFRCEFSGGLSYLPKEKTFEGQISYPGRILWIKNPTLVVRWSKSRGFRVHEFKLDGKGFPLLKALEMFAKALFCVITGSAFSWGLSLEVQVTKSPRREHFRVTLTAKFSVELFGIIKLLVIPLPEIPFDIPTKLSFKNLPKRIMDTLWTNAKNVCKAFLEYLNPIELAQKIFWTNFNSIKEQVETVIEVGTAIVNTAVEVGRAIWEGKYKIEFENFGEFEGAFILDGKGNIICYVCGGKGGKFRNKRFTVETFGPYLAVMSKTTDLHASLDIRDHENRDDRQHTNKARRNLNEMAHKMLVATDVKAIIDCDQILIEWKDCRGDGKTYTESDDGGDIDHHIQVIATTQSDQPGEPTRNETLYDQVVNMTTTPENANELRRHAVDIHDPTVLQRTITITISILPRVTMRLKTLPLSTSFSTKDTDWRNNAKRRMKRVTVKSVTLEGKKGQISKPPPRSQRLQGVLEVSMPMAFPFPRDRRMQAVAMQSYQWQKPKLHITAVCSYSELRISGNIAPLVGATWYQVEVVDRDNHSLVVGQTVVSGDEYSIELSALQDPTHPEIADSSGPYTVVATALEADYEAVSERSFLEHLSLTRHSAPERIDYVLPNLTISEDDTVTVSWTISSTDTSKSGSYILKLVGSQLLEKELNDDNSGSEDSDSESSDDQSAPESDIDEPNFACPDDYDFSFLNDIRFSDHFHTSTYTLLWKEVLPTTDDPSQCCCTFSLKETLQNHKGKLNQPMFLYLTAIKASDDSRLPSVPRKSSEFTVIATPDTLKCSVPEDRAGLLVAWSYSLNAFGYRLELISLSTGEVVPLEPKDYYYEKGTRSSVAGCDTERLLLQDNLGHLPYNDPRGYKLQISALGSGSYIRSLFPKQTEESIHVLQPPVQLVYFPQSDSLEVRFELPVKQALESYCCVVELLYWSGEGSNLLASKTIHPTYRAVSCTFTVSEWRPELHDCATVTAWVAFNHFNQAHQHPIANFSFGKSQNFLLIFPAHKIPEVKLVYTSEIDMSYSYAKLADHEGTKVFTNASLHGVWTFHLTSGILRCSAVFTQRLEMSRYIVLPHEKAFPNVPSRIHEKFWATDDLALPHSGYLYSCELLECTDSVLFMRKKWQPFAQGTREWKNLNPFEVVKPSSQHSEMHILLYVKCSSICKFDGSLKMDLAVRTLPTAAKRARIEQTGSVIVMEGTTPPNSPTGDTRHSEEQLTLSRPRLKSAIQKRLGALKRKVSVAGAKVMKTVTTAFPRQPTWEEFKREKVVRIPLQGQEDRAMIRRAAILIRHVPLQEIDSCTITLVLSGEFCVCEELDLFVRFV